MKGSDYMFNIFKKKKTVSTLTPEQMEDRRLIQMAKEAGIDLPGPKKICARRVGTPLGMNYWYPTTKQKAIVAKRELEKRGLI